MLEQLKEELYQLHLELVKYNLVVWTGGNISARDPASGLVAIKPSGVRYEHLRPQDMVVLDLEGTIVEGHLKPSSDTYSHLYIYRHRADVGGVVHTHSRYATAFAAVGQPIPVVLTAMADEFGGPIPCGGFSLIGDESIGKLVVESIGTLAGGVTEEPRRIHHRPERRSRGQGRRHDRGRRRLRLAGAATRHPRRDTGCGRGEAPSSLQAYLRAGKMSGCALCVVRCALCVVRVCEHS